MTFASSVGILRRSEISHIAVYEQLAGVDQPGSRLSCVGSLLMRRHVPESPRWLVTHGWGRQADAADRQAVDGSKKPKLSIFCAFPWNKRLSRTRARRNRIESAQPELQSDEVENFLRNVAA